ncbi:Eco57I restriction-modification methylase domain-containing protein [Okeania sp.]|uniref:Eco57I restriction-modification methylase domain-containing protein n=1 Tax=Okeania sp. TaxID=3100323 RepID=UPI002B4AB442|nr:N-6 DNA methylase [Okeania sp.]MEB3341513.1 N-6 DNA methylase [Okeania sp.]
MKIESSARHHQTKYSAKKRKLLGVHYTPDNVIDYIVSNTLFSYLEKNKFIPLQKIKILDPACGSGLFLLKAFDLLCSLWKKQFGRLNPEDIRHILENNLYGVDIDNNAVNEAKKQLKNKAKLLGIKEVNIPIFQGDALLHSFTDYQINLLCSSPKIFNWQENFPQVFAEGGFDCIIGNPPYIRIQNLQPKEHRTYYVEKYQTARGRFDIAGLFIELGYYLLKPQGQLSYIISNKLLTTQGAKALRTYILKHYNLIEIIDLGDTKLFEAAILPMILTIEKQIYASDYFLYTSIKQIRKLLTNYLKVENLFELLNQQPSCEFIQWQQRYFQVKQFKTSLPKINQSIWTFHTTTEQQLLEKLKQNTFCTLADISHKISVGIKTTADNVFIKPMTFDFINNLHLESTVIFPLLSSHNVYKWHCDWQEKRDLYVLYPYKYQNNKLLPIDLNIYPNTQKYLLSHQKQLEARTYINKSGRQWYEIWVHQSPTDFQNLKIVTPDISTHNCFAIDNKGLFVNGTCFYILLKEESLEHYLLILSLLNSKVLEFFHKVTSGNTLYSQRFRYWTSYLKSYPIPNFRQEKSLTPVNQLIENTRLILQCTNKKEQQIIEENNDRLIYKWFNLVDDEIQQIEQILYLNKR